MQDVWNAYRRGSVGDAVVSAGHAMQYARSSADQKNLAQICFVLGYLYRVQGDLERAETLFMEGLSILEASAAPDPEDRVGARLDIALLYMLLARVQEADALLKATMSDAIKNLGLQHRYTAAVLALQGKVLALQGQYESAEFWYAQAMKSGVESFTGTDSENFSAVDVGVETLGGIAYVYEKQERFDQALKILKKLLHTREKHWGETHPNVARILIRIGSLHIEQKRYDDAELNIQRAFEIMKRAMSESSPQMVECRALLAKLYFFTARPDRARPLIEKAIATAERIYPTGHRLIEQYRDIQYLDVTIPVGDKSSYTRDWLAPDTPDRGTRFPQ